MSKVYARQINPEYQEPQLFFISAKDHAWHWEDDYYAGLAVMPLRGYYDYMPDVVRRVYDTLHDGELADVLDDIQRGPGYWGYDQYDGSRTKAISDYLPAEKANGKRYATREIKRLSEIISGAYDPDTDDLCAVLSIVTGQGWTSRQITGCCQGDWREIVYPVEKYDKEAIEILECEYFNLGTEWMVHDSDEAPECPEDISGWCIYCHGWNDDAVRAEIADAAGCNPEELTMYKYAGSHFVAEYEEVV